MHWLSQNVEELVAIAGRQVGSGDGVDVVVVGSGYGGAVAAMRFAQAGRTVFVLERGQEYVAGEFPNDLSQAGGHVRVEAAAQTGVSVMGNEDALFDFRIGLRAGALVGNGLGGGSLINAAVGLEPAAQVFRQPSWPTALRDEDLSPWFATARDMLEVRTPAAAGPSGLADGARFDLRQTAKYQRLHALGRVAAKGRAKVDRGRNVVARFEAAPLAIQIDGTPRTDRGPRANCTGCGDCVTGCNVDAKLSLTKTYLPAAFQAGARMFTGVSVLTVQYDPAGSAAFPWLLRWVRTGERRLQHRRASAAGGTDAQDDWVQQIRARTVILAAGTFGSTEILLRSQARGLSVSSTALGVRVSGNGDDVSAACKLDADANAVGQGCAEPSAQPPGPTISGILRFEDAVDVSRSTLIEDGAAPGLTREFFHELLATLGAVSQLERFGLDKREGGDPLALQPQLLQRSLLLLGIGHDTASGRIRLDVASDRVRWEWTGAGTEPVAALHESRVAGIRQLGGIHLRNPASGLLPGAVGDMLTGPAIGGALFTVHPLGGCRMADKPHSGVVDDTGAVFRADGTVHDGLFVMDGSVIPSALGVNPMLTITALAERACARILAAGSDPASCSSAATTAATTATTTAPPPRDLPAPVSVPAYRRTETAAAGAVMHEVLRGPVELHDGIACLGRGPAKAALHLRLPVPDWRALFADAQHRVTIDAAPDDDTDPSSWLDLQGPQQASCCLRVRSGTVTLFRPLADAGRARAGRFLRLALTYLIGRWLPDMRKAPPSDQNLVRRLRSMAQTGWMAGKGLVHATEVRLFEYRLQLQAGDGVRYELSACKRIDGAASWSQLAAWLSARRRLGGWPALQRSSVWQQLGQLPFELRRADGSPSAPGAVVLAGTLTLDVIDVMRRVLPQMGDSRDFLGALFALASYPMLLLRYLLTARLLDFRAPDYRPDLPGEDPALAPPRDDAFELLRPGNLFAPIPVRGGSVTPELPVRLDVRRSLGSALTDRIRIGLIRYRQPVVQWAQDASGVHRARSIVLLNGFAQSTRAFVAPELGAGCLASMLFDAGWDVWLLEYRVSPLLDASAQYATMDDIAAFDIPAAVDYIVHDLAQHHDRPADRIQISAYSHCVGSASLAMSILGGYLRLPYQPPSDAAEPPPELNRLSAVSFSQFLPFVVGSQTAQQRLQLVAFLQNVLGRDMVEFTAGTVQPDLVHALLDRVFASLHYTHDEQCPHERHDLRLLQPDSTTCKRMAGLLSRLFRHDQLDARTHEQLDWYFGRTNLGVFLHGVKCVEYERLVNAEGQNAYATDTRLRQRLTMPLLLQQGMENVLFDAESLGRSHSQLLRAFGQDAARSRVAIQPLPGYAHFDCTIGRNAPGEIFPRVVGFFDESHRAPAPIPNGSSVCTRARLARTGPIVGWVRPAGEGRVTVRVWIELDTTSVDEPVAAMTDVRYRTGTQTHREVRAWAYHERSLAVGDIPSPSWPPDSGRREAKIVHALADVEVPADARELCIRMFGVYRFIIPPTASGGPDPVPPGFPPAWGRPMSLGDVGSGWDPLGSPLLVRQPQPAPAPADPLASADAASGRPADHADPVLAGAAAVDAHAGDDGPADREALRCLFPLSAEVADRLLATLEASLQNRCTIALRADPGTLSRQMRSTRALVECEVRLGEAQLRTHGEACTFLAAGCRHPGITGFEAQRADRSLNDIATGDAADANCMFMLGDQIYADARAGLMDTASVIERLVPRYRTAFGSPGFRRVASRVPLFMAPDDHEIEEAWSGEHLAAGRDARLLRENAGTLFASFQRAHGPDHDPSSGASAHSYLVERPAAGFVVLDTRFDRRTRPQPTVVSQPTWRWLEDSLERLQAQHGDRPKFIVSGSVFAPGLHAGQGRFPAGGVDGWQQFHDERVRMLRFLMERRIRNVVFLSSDYHCSAVAQLTAGDASGFSAWAVVAPPLHAPMRFANTQPHELLDDEYVPVPGHADVHIALQQCWSGEGWLRCTLRACPDTAGWRLQLSFELRDLDSGDRTTQACEIGLPGSAPA
ncbi:GMC oxidoreductase [Comamonadaceae bacterium G21597-S1]|nr:GMC oxidoreductase [Comamonadaceae bacterium G21597-S1]